LAGLGPAIHAAPGSDDLVVKIVPIQAFFEDEADLPSARPMLDVHFTLFGDENVIVPLGVDQPGQPVSLCEPVCDPFAMFLDAPSKIGCRADV